MSWDILMRSPQVPMGSMEQAREVFLSACDRILGTSIPRRGPTAISIDPSFDYEVSFGHNKRAVQEVTLYIHIDVGDPQKEPQHPVWSFLTQLREFTGWEVIDTSTGEPIG